MIIYRFTTEQDAEILASARISLLNEDSGIARDALDTLFVSTRDYMRQSLQNGSFFAFAAFEGDELIATAGATLYEVLPGIKLPNGKIAYIQNVYVAPEHRRVGVGRELIRLCVDESQARGYTRITLSATESGAELFKTCGFAPAPHVGLFEMEFLGGL